MAFTSILRKSVSTLAPLAMRVTRVQRNYHSCIFTALNHSFQSQRPATNWFRSNSHFFSTADESRRTSSYESLIRILESEVQCAEESDEHDQVEETSGEFPFEIEDILFIQTVTLTRKYGGELIKIEVHMPELKGEDVVNNDVVCEKPTGFFKIPTPFEKKFNFRRFISLPLIVNVSKKGGPCLEFNISAFPDEIAIDSLSVRNPDSAYEGPDFHDLDENLQKAFHKYLEIRGIKPILTNFMHEYMINKYCRRRERREVLIKSLAEEQRLKFKKELKEGLNESIKEERRLTFKKELKEGLNESIKEERLTFKKELKEGLNESIKEERFPFEEVRKALNEGIKDCSITEEQRLKFKKEFEEGFIEERFNSKKTKKAWKEFNKQRRTSRTSFTKHRRTGG